MTSDEVVDRPTEWVAEHIRHCVKRRGEEGHVCRGVPTLLLTTTGRKSGLRRRTALIYGRDEDHYVIVASKGGYHLNSLWYDNLIADPIVELQVSADVFTAKASPIRDRDSYERLWSEMVSIWPRFSEYKLKTVRQIPLVKLEPAV